MDISIKKKLWIHLGPGKSGSTWIYNIAKNNQHIFYLPIIKETQAFHSLSSFNHSFYNKKKTDSANIICDFSNTYIFNPIAISNLKKIGDDTNIEYLTTALLRCPLKRTLSHYKYLISSGEISNLSFRELMAIEPSILWRSRYDIHIEHIKNFDLNCNLFVLEEQNAEIPEIIQAVLNYFNIQGPNIFLDNIDKFESRVSRNFLLSKAAKVIAKYLRNNKHYYILENLKSNNYVRNIFTKNEIINYDFCEEDISNLRLYFLPVKEYCKDLGLNVSKWLL